MHHPDRRFQGMVERLRSPERLALMEVDRVVDLCLQHIQAASLLDVGTGTAVWAEAFAARGLAVAGVDVSAEMLEHARRYVPTGRFELAAAETLPFDAQAFDLVFLGHVLHETDDPVRALSEARRVSRLRVAVLEWPYRQEEQGPPLEHRLRREQVEGFARSAGLAAVQFTPLDHMDLYLMPI